MGEANRRRATGASRSALAGRGILFSHLLNKLGSNGVTTKHLNQDSYNSAVIYWDKIACPTNNLVHVALKEEDILIKEGVLIRPKINFTGTIHSGQLASAATQAQVDAFRKLEQENPGFWSFGETSPEDLQKSNLFTPSRTFLVNIVNALPLPPEETSVESILEFKNKRLPELHRLRHAMDEIYLKISNANDSGMALQFQIDEIDKACADAIKVSKEWWRFVKFSDLKSLISLGGAATAAALGYNMNMPTTAAIAGGAGTMISVAQGIKSKIRSNRKLPFWYAAEVSRRFR